MYACNIRTLFNQCVQVNKNVHQILRAQHGTRTHYETLNLKPNCTAKDIRDSFVKLSKENHPDTGENTKQNAERFCAIVEAYKVLGKAESRAVYDSVMSHDSGPYAVYNYNESSSPSPSNTGYYGVFGSKRVSNKRIVMYCMIFMVVGAIVQALAIRYSLTFQRDKLDRVSMEAGRNLSKARANAEEYGNDYQLKQLAHKSTRN
ncbi:hypothetical protein HA402_011908 [Bradysia odoriphaga]|nr:hypothetical protein HA402_011908 [Bradysia odoriphaga]